MSNAQAEKSTHAAPPPDGGGGDDLAKQVESLLTQVDTLASELAVPEETPALADTPIQVPPEEPADPGDVVADAGVTQDAVESQAAEPSAARPDEDDSSPAADVVADPRPASSTVADAGQGSAVAQPAVNVVEDSHASAPENIDELDAQLAHLTDSLIQEAKSGDDADHASNEDLEAAANAISDAVTETQYAPPAPAASVSAEPVAAPASVVQPHPAATEHPERVHASPTPVHTPEHKPAPSGHVESKSEGPSIVTRAKLAAGSMLGKASGQAGELALNTLSMPLRSQPVAVRDTLGWVALATLFWATCLWAYMLLFYKPPMPEPPSNPTALVATADGEHGQGHAGVEGEGHASGSHSAPSSHAPAKAAASHAAKPAKAEGHGEKTASKEGGHGGAAAPKKFDKPILDQFTVVPAAGAKPAKKEAGHGGGH